MGHTPFSPRGNSILEAQEGVIKYPDDYPFLHVGQLVGIITNPGDQVNKYQVSEREEINPIDLPDNSTDYNTNYIVTAGGGTYDCGNFSDHFEPEDNCLYVLAFGALCDVNMGVLVSIPSGMMRGGVKKHAEVYLRTDEMGYHQPTHWVYSWTKDKQPNVRLKNDCEYDNYYLKFMFFGFKYKLKSVKEGPNPNIILNISGIVGG